MCERQSVGGEGGGGGLQGAGGVGASHVGEEVGVRAQLMDVEAVLLAVRQTSPDKRLGSRGECVIQRAAGCGCVCVCVCSCTLCCFLFRADSDVQTCVSSSRQIEFFV